MRFLGKGLAAAAAIVLIGVAVPGPARANFIGTATDPAGDIANPGHDLVAAAMEYDRRSGRLLGMVRFRGSPDERGFVTVFAGVQTATGCDGFPAAGFGSYSDEFGASWLRLDSSGLRGPSGEADKDGGGSAVQTFEASERALADGPWNCVTAVVTEPGNAANIYDAVEPVALVGQPTLAVGVRGAPRRLVPNRSRRLRITVSNTGDGPARRVKLRLGKARGLRAGPRFKSLGTIAAGRRKTVAVRVALRSGAPLLTKLVVKASSGELVARRTVELRLRTPARRPGGGGGGGGGGGSCVRYLPDLSGETGGSLILVPC